MPANHEKKAKELERAIAFQSGFQECPQSAPNQPEPPAPDILFPESKLGIEITEYSLHQGKDGSLPRQRETVHQRITARAQELYEARLTRHLQVSIKWTIFHSCPSRREEEEISQRIKWYVFEETSIRLQACMVSWEDLNEPLFTKYGIEITIYPIPGEGRSCWSSMAAYAFPPEATRIQNVLDEKEDRVVEYRKACDQVWLLIVEDARFFSSQFTPDSRLAQVKFNSSFDRVFLLEEPQNTIHEFQVNK